MKKWLFLTLLMIFGGLMFFSLNNNNNKKEQPNHQEAALLRQEQEAIALYLVNNYDDIETLNFDRISKNRKTGFTHVYIDINNDIRINVSFGEYGGHDYVIGIYPNSQRLVESNDDTMATLENVKINYYEGDIE